MLKITFINMKNMIKSEKLIMLIMVLSLIFSSMIINFSYGLYQNYTKQKYENEVNLKDLDPEVNRNFTKEELKNFADNLPSELADEMLVIYASGYSEDFIYADGDTTPLSIPTRFTIRDGKYSICYETKENWQGTGLIPYGRYINDTEEANGENVALIPTGMRTVMNVNEKDMVYNVKKMVENNETISIFGKEYKVIGAYNAGSLTPIVPFLSIPDDFEYNSFGVTFYENITRKQYEEIVSLASEYIPGAFTFPDLDLPDSDSVYMYNNIILISIFIAIVTIINFGMLYIFILKKRSNQIGIIRLCGATRFQTVRIFLSECLIIGIPMCILGIMFFDIILNNFFANAFEYMDEFFNIKVYLAVFLLYMLMFVIILGIMIIKTINSKIINVLKEVKI